MAIARGKTKDKAISLLDIQEIRREKAIRCKASFAYFLRQAWHVIEPARPLIWGLHTEASAIHLQAIGDGELHKLIANIAPGFGKSSMYSVAYPAWIWTRNPHERFLCASYALDLSIRDNRNCRMLVESEWYQNLFADVFQMAPDQSQKSYWENDKRGYRLATAVQASGTGKRGSCLIIDDPNNAMAGQADILATTEWFARTWISRLNDQEKGSMIVVGQRLHQSDLTEHLLGLGNWTHLNLPTEYDPSRKCYTSIGWEDPREVEGELLCPELLDAKSVVTLKSSLGSVHYAAQYQQSPFPAGGSKFKSQWFRYFSETDEAYFLETPQGVTSILKSSCWKFGTSDLAISSKQSADYSVFAVWAVTNSGELLLLHVFRERIDNASQLRQIKTLHMRFMPDFWKIETVAYQLAFFQQALREWIPCREYKPVRDKESRATTASVWSENGKTYWLKGASWLPEWETELLVFPRGAHDDMVDCYSQAADEVSIPMIPLGGYTSRAEEKPTSVIEVPREGHQDPFAWASQHLGGDW